MLLGGGTTATRTTEIIDMGAGHPAGFRSRACRRRASRWMRSSCPLGKSWPGRLVAAMRSQVPTAGTLICIDPGTNTFTSAGTNNFDRLYHSVALLLPDATVWSAGSNPSRGTWETHMEIYQPAYLFTRDSNNNMIAATRPTIASVPPNISWAGAFTVSTPDAASISQVVLVRPGPVDPRVRHGPASGGDVIHGRIGTLTVTGPPNSKIARPAIHVVLDQQQWGAVGGAVRSFEWRPDRIRRPR